MDEATKAMLYDPLEENYRQRMIGSLTWSQERVQERIQQKASWKGRWTALIQRTRRALAGSLELIFN